MTTGLLAIRHDMGLLEKCLHCENTRVLLFFKKAYLDPLNAEEKDQPEWKSFQNIEKGALGILLKATLPTKMSFYLFAICTYCDQCRTHLLVILCLETLSYNLTKKTCRKYNGNSLNTNSQKSLAQRETNCIYFVTQVLISLL